MGASKTAKSLGAPSVRWVAEVWGCSESAMYKRFKSDPYRFEIIVAGCVARRGNG